MAKSLKGHCLCGAVKFEATPENMEMGVCHCSMCRRWSGGVFMAVPCTGLKFGDDSHLKSYRASAWGERLFCDQCGSTLIWQTQDHSHISVSAQAFENPEAFGLTSEIFIDQKPANYEFANKTQKFTEAEVFAMFAPSESN